MNEGSWLDIESIAALTQKGHLRKEFEGFIQGWQKLYRIEPEYKIIIADMQSFFLDLRLWLDQLELAILSSAEADRPKLEEYVTTELIGSIIPCINALFEKFRKIVGAQGLDEDNRQAHRSYMRRQLHPLILCAPFAHRNIIRETPGLRGGIMRW